MSLHLVKNKNKPKVKAYRTVIQALVPAIPFILGLLAIPEVQGALNGSEVAAGTLVYAVLVFTLTYVQNKLGK